MDTTRTSRTTSPDGSDVGAPDQEYVGDISNLRDFLAAIESKGASPQSRLAIHKDGKAKKAKLYHSKSKNTMVLHPSDEDFDWDEDEQD